MDSNLGVGDVGRLGTAQLIVSSAEFSLKPSPLGDLLLAFSVAIVIPLSCKLTTQWLIFGHSMVDCQPPTG